MGLENNSNQKEKALILLALIGAIIAFIIWGLFPKKDKIIKTKNSNQNISTTEYSSLLELNKDIDGNGVPAWREEIFGIDSSFSEQNNTATSNLTASIVNDFMSISLLSNKKDINTDLYLSASIDNILNEVNRKEVYQINISLNNSKEAIKEYGNGVAKMFFFLYENKNKDIENLEKYLQTKDKKYLENIKKISSEVNDGCNQLKNYAVPQKASEIHKKVLQECFYLNEILKSFTEVEQDSLKSLVALKRYQDMSLGITSLYNDLSSFFEKNNIIFNYNEYGAIFNK